MQNTKNQVLMFGVFVSVCVLCGLLIDRLSFKVASRSWDLSPLNTTLDSTDSLRILVVSDPQLVGENEEFWLVGFITRMDSDWFLAYGYQEALTKSNPDVVLFLGDLLDEGSKASDAQFKSYVARFKNIFKTPPHVKTISIPGDNDIGGEGMEAITPPLLNRFFQHFPSQTVTNINFVDFITIKDFGRSIYSVSIREDEIASSSNSSIRIFISHLGLLDHYHYLRPKAASVDPHLVLSGHEHRASYITCYKCWKGPSKKMVRMMIDELSINTNILDKSLLHQIVTPTSNYRMGVNYPGYGLLDLDSAGNTKYRVLWLPRRYPLLYTYLVFSFLVAFFITLRTLFAFYSTHTQASKTN